MSSPTAVHCLQHDLCTITALMCRTTHCSAAGLTPTAVLYVLHDARSIFVAPTASPYNEAHWGKEKDMKSVRCVVPGDITY